LSKDLARRNDVRKAASALAAIGITVAALVVPQAGARGLPSECVEAGLAPPSLMKAHFYLTDFHPRQTIPHVFYQYRVKALPSQCQGKAVQEIEVKVRYKTANFPVKTLWVEQYSDWPLGGQGYDHDHPAPQVKRTWMALYGGDGGTGLPGGDPIPASGYMVINECAPSRVWNAKPGGPPNVFGTVQNVSAIERRSVRDVGSGSVWTRTRSLPVTFSRNRLRWTQANGSDALCLPGQPVSDNWTNGLQWLE
jgi:hypothetical protein